MTYFEENKDIAKIMAVLQEAVPRIQELVKELGLSNEEFFFETRFHLNQEYNLEGVVFEGITAPQITMGKLDISDNEEDEDDE